MASTKSSSLSTARSPSSYTAPSSGSTSLIGSSGSSSTPGSTARKIAGSSVISDAQITPFSRLRFYRANGNGNIQEDIYTGKTVQRMFLRLVFVRVHFSGSNTNLADITVAVKSNTNTRYDCILDKTTNVGLNTDYFLVIPRDQLAHPSPWTISRADKFRVSWTNPSAGNINWGLEAGYIAD